MSPRSAYFAAALLTVFAAGCSHHPAAVPEDAAAPATVPPSPPPPPVPPPSDAPPAVAQQVRRAEAAAAKAEARRLESVVVTGSVLSAPQSPVADRYAPEPEVRENYGHFDANPVQRVAEQPVSTFSIDVDTGAYANVRRFLNQGQLPPHDAVRVEELINYFDYADAPPPRSATPFAVHTEIGPTPWNPKTHLLRVGIQGWRPNAASLPPSNLVFLVDVSGSMNDPVKLPLVQASLKLLAKQLRHEDRVSLVTYAAGTQVVLEPTPGDDVGTISAAIDQLHAGGGTNGASGIQLAYQMAQKAFIKNGNNRVLLATDGDFNLGISNFEQLKNLVEERRRSGIALTTLGVGTGNYNERLMEQIADAGNGNYAYLDTLQEAQKVLVEQRAATLLTIARDVKIQLQFNPAVVAEYRLIGYENRALKREDFSNDAVDAGEIGAGHHVTALYELALVGDGGERIEPLRYAQPAGRASKSGELGFLRLRYKRPEDGVNAASQLIEQPIQRASIRSATQTSEAYRLAAAVAAYGQLLRGGTYTGAFGYADVVALARGARGEDRNGYVGDFLQLVQLADSLQTQPAQAGRVGED